jgi:hypothetical protein
MGPIVPCDGDRAKQAETNQLRPVFAGLGRPDGKSDGLGLTPDGQHLPGCGEDRQLLPGEMA